MNDAARIAEDRRQDRTFGISARIDTVPLREHILALRATGQAVVACGLRTVSEIDGLRTTDVNHILNDVQTSVHATTQALQSRYQGLSHDYKLGVASTKEINDLTLHLNDCQSDPDAATTKLEESGEKLRAMEVDWDQYKEAYAEECLQHSEHQKVQDELMKQKASLEVSLDQALNSEGSLTAESKRQIIALESDLNATRKREAEPEYCQRDSEIKLRQMEDLEATNERQSKRIRDLKHSKGQFQEYNNRLWDDMGSLRAELNAVPAELSKRDRTVADLQQQIQGLTEDGERDATEILLLQNDIVDKASALERMRKDEARRTNGLRRAKKELRRVREGKTQVKSLLRGTNVDLSKVARSEYEAEREASRLVKEKDELTDKLTESQGHLAKSNIHVSHLENQLSDSSKTIHHQAVELRNIREDLKDKEDKLTQADVRITQLSLGVGKLSGQLEVLQKSVTESRNDAASRTQERSTLEEKFKITQRDLNLQTKQCSSQARLLEQISTLERQVQDRDALADFLLEWPQKGRILRCFVEHDDKEVRLMIRIDQGAGEVHCLVLYADHTCEVRRHQVTECLTEIRNWAPYLHLGRTDPLVLVTEGDRWDWLRGNFEVESTAL